VPDFQWANSDFPSARFLHEGKTYEAITLNILLCIAVIVVATVLSI
jgi:TctA family transporter